MGALTPLVKEATGRRSWVEAVALYTFAGALSSVFVGAFVAAAGSIVPGIDDGSIASRLGVAVIIGVLAARELRLVSFPLPQVRRQTSDTWAKIFGSNVAATLWGADLGLAFSTWITFSGAWALAVLAFAAGDAWLGAALFGVFWVGRVLPTWVGPALLPDGRTTPQLMIAIAHDASVLRLAHIGALAGLVGLVTGSLVLVGT